MLSDSTESVDRGEKMRIYARLVRVPEYYLYQPQTGAIEGYRLDPDQLSYEPMAKGANGRYVSASLGLLIGDWEGTHAGYVGHWLRFFTEAGQMLPSPLEDRDRLAARLLAYEQKFGPIPE